MSRPSLASDASVLWTLMRGQTKTGTHAARLESFYRPQADRYDEFRARLLNGRDDLIRRIEIAPGMRVVELGGGTGSLLDRLGPVAATCASIELVDLCPSLLAIARKRAQGRPNVRVVEADATDWTPQAPVDRVILSYALTMIPDWAAAIGNAVSMLRPGGLLGVVDFHLPVDGGVIYNGFWRRWFAHDGVHLSQAHLPTLIQALPGAWVDERRSRLPYVPALDAPYYLFVGRKPETCADGMAAI